MAWVDEVGAGSRTGVPGRNATSPWRMPWAAWKEIALRSWSEASDDNIGLIAAGVAFYGFLALVPLLGAVVLSYGLVAEPSTVVKNMQALTSVMPADAAKLIGEQLLNVVTTSGGKKGLGLLLALALALFGARNGAGSIITALNIAYEEKETRGFLKVNLLAVAITAVAVLVAILALIAIAALGHLEDMLPAAPGIVLLLGKLLSYLLLALAGAAGVATLYRYGPARQHARWVWLTPGSMLAALGWIALTFGFGVYVANFGNYNATYGSLGAVVVLLTWLYLSCYLLLLCAELNSELEHQTAQDTTTGAPRAPGERGAWVADHVAHGSAESAGASTVQAAPRPIETRLSRRSSLSLPKGRIGARLGRVVGGGHVPWSASLLAGGGLSLLCRRSRTVQGLALLISAAVIVMIQRDDHHGGNEDKTT